METLQEYQAGVFSAHAEVVPVSSAPVAARVRILRARGGSSDGPVTLGVGVSYSPRTRR